MMKAELTYLQNALVIENFTYYAEEEARGNPYNTTFTLRVVSGSFSGIANCEYDMKDFKRFILQLNELYDFKRTSVELSDICYGSNVVFALDKVGHLEIKGTIYGCAMEHSMTFVFTADQSALPPLIQTLSALVEESERKCYE